MSRCDDDHIARLAYEKAGGTSRELWFGHDLEPGRGLGFSASARAAGAVLARIEQGDDLDQAHGYAYPLVAELEGHGDNAAPSVFGGVHVITGDQNHRLTVGLPGRLLCWVPDIETATEASRQELPETVLRSDAVFNIGRVALLMAALHEGDLSMLRRATEDRLHQPMRLSRCSPSGSALDAALEAGAAAAWLSGSGPTVAIVVGSDRVDDVLGALPAEGHVLAVDEDIDGSTLIEEVADLPSSI